MITIVARPDTPNTSRLNKMMFITILNHLSYYDMLRCRLDRRTYYWFRDLYSQLYISKYYIISPLFCNIPRYTYARNKIYQKNIVRSRQASLISAHRASINSCTIELIYKLGYFDMLDSEMRQDGQHNLLCATYGHIDEIRWNNISELRCHNNMEVIQHLVQLGLVVSLPTKILSKIQKNSELQISMMKACIIADNCELYNTIHNSSDYDVVAGYKLPKNIYPYINAILSSSNSYLLNAINPNIISRTVSLSYVTHADMACAIVNRHISYDHKLIRAMYVADRFEIFAIFMRVVENNIKYNANCDVYITSHHIYNPANYIDVGIARSYRYYELLKITKSDARSMCTEAYRCGNFSLFKYIIDRYPIDYTTLLGAHHFCNNYLLKK